MSQLMWRDVVPSDVLITMVDMANPVLSLICMASGSPFCHAEMAEAPKEKVILGSYPQGFDRMVCPNRHMMVLGFKDLALGGRALGVARGCIGTPYDYLGFAFAGLALLLNNPDIKLAEPEHRSRICAEMIGDIIVKAGADPRPDIPDGGMMPCHFIGSDLFFSRGYLFNG